MTARRLLAILGLLLWTDAFLERIDAVARLTAATTSILIATPGRDAQQDLLGDLQLMLNGTTVATKGGLTPCHDGSVAKNGSKGFL